MTTTPATNEKLLTVVETFNTMAQAEILKRLLEANGIPVMLAYEPASVLPANFAGRVAPVDLLAPAEQAAEARRILEHFHAGRLQRDEP